MAALRIELLGGFRVAVGDRAVPEQTWRRRKPAALLKLLALAPGHRLHREQAMDRLWPELAPAAAAANLRKALHQARRGLGRDGLIASRGELLCLPEEQLTVDVDEFLAALDHARRTGEPDDYARAVELYRGELLPEDRFEEWAIQRREELQGEFVAVLEELAGLLEARGDLPAASRVARRLLAADPLREESHARLIRLHALAGRRGEALRQYERLRELLAAELGTEPSAETQRLYEADQEDVRACHQALAALWEQRLELYGATLAG